jgi:hypothetical protein
MKGIALFDNSLSLEARFGFLGLFGACFGWPLAPCVLLGCLCLLPTAIRLRALQNKGH